jgi:hypothetical protein
MNMNILPPKIGALHRASKHKIAIFLKMAEMID